MAGFLGSIVVDSMKSFTTADKPVTISLVDEHSEVEVWHTEQAEQRHQRNFHHSRLHYQHQKEHQQ
ncbi:unnamed protein product [Penicillium glandicola]